MLSSNYFSNSWHTRDTLPSNLAFECIWCPILCQQTYLHNHIFTYFLSFHLFCQSLWIASLGLGRKQPCERWEMISHFGHHHNTKQKQQEEKQDPCQDPYYPFPTYNSLPPTTNHSISWKHVHFCSVYPGTVVAEEVTLAGTHEEHTRLLGSDWKNSLLLNDPKVRGSDLPLPCRQSPNWV